MRPSLRGRPLELLVDVDPEVPDALRSPSAGFGVALLAARLRVVEDAARAGRMAELGPAVIAAAHADRALATRLSGS